MVLRINSFHKIGCEKKLCDIKYVLSISRKDIDFGKFFKYFTKRVKNWFQFCEFDNFP